MRGFSFSEASGIVGVPQSRLRAWARAALIRPALATEPNAVFGFRDLVGARRVAALLQSGVSLPRIRRAVRAISERLPEIDRPVESLRLWRAGSPRLVVRHAGALFEPNGQGMLDLPPPHVRGTEVVRLEEQPRSRAADCRSALEWFERGCRLDTDPLTQERAIDAYRRALLADPAFSDAYCNLGSVYHVRGHRKSARDCYEKALRLDPAHVEANLNLAGLWEEDGRETLALRCYRTALRAEPLRAETHLALALIYEKLRALHCAREHWRRYLQLAPQGAWAEIARRHLEIRLDGSPAPRA